MIIRTLLSSDHKTMEHIAQDLLKLRQLHENKDKNSIDPKFKQEFKFISTILHDGKMSPREKANKLQEAAQLQNLFDKNSTDPKSQQKIALIKKLLQNDRASRDQYANNLLALRKLYEYEEKNFFRSQLQEELKNTTPMRRAKALTKLKLIQVYLDFLTDNYRNVCELYQDQNEEMTKCLTLSVISGEIEESIKNVIDGVDDNEKAILERNLEDIEYHETSSSEQDTYSPFFAFPAVAESYTEQNIKKINNGNFTLGVFGCTKEINSLKLWEVENNKFEKLNVYDEFYLKMAKLQKLNEMFFDSIQNNDEGTPTAESEALLKEARNILEQHDSLEDQLSALDDIVLKYIHQLRLKTHTTLNSQSCGLFADQLEQFAMSSNGLNFPSKYGPIEISKMTVSGLQGIRTKQKNFGEQVHLFTEGHGFASLDDYMAKKQLKFNNDSLILPHSKNPCVQARSRVVLDHLAKQNKQYAQELAPLLAPRIMENDRKRWPLNMTIQKLRLVLSQLKTSKGPWVQELLDYTEHLLKKYPEVEGPRNEAVQLLQIAIIKIYYAADENRRTFFRRSNLAETLATFMREEFGIVKDSEYSRYRMGDFMEKVAQATVNKEAPKETGQPHVNPTRTPVPVSKNDSSLFTQKPQGPAPDKEEETGQLNIDEVPSENSGYYTPSSGSSQTFKQ